MKKIDRFEGFSEGKAYQASKTPVERKAWDTDKREAFRKKVQDLVKSQGCTTKQVGNDFEIHFKGKHIAQAMFRKDYVGIKKVGTKFTKEFNYDELGKIKSEMTSIIKDCKLQLVDESKLAPEIQSKASAARNNNPGKSAAELNKQNVEKEKLEREKEKNPKKEEEKEKELVESIKKFNDFVKEKMDPTIQQKAADARKQNPGKSAEDINKQNVEKEKLEKEKNPKKEEKEEVMESKGSRKSFRK